MNRDTINFVLGLLFIAALTGLAFLLREIPFIKDTLKLSPLIIGIVLGMIWGNLPARGGVPFSWGKGIAFAAKKILRLAIIFYGFRLLLADVINAGWQAVVIDAIIVCSVLFLGELIGRWLRISPELRILTASGSAICGAAAVLGTEPVVKGSSNDSVIAVATVVIFGTLSMFLYPIAYRAGWLHLTDTQMAIYTGSSLHEVAHVAGAGASMGEGIAGMATITKMIRVIFLAPVLIVLGVLFRSKDSQTTGKQAKITIPWFAIIFLVAIGINSLLQEWAKDYNFVDTYKVIVDYIKVLDDFALSMAMTAIGFGALFANMRKAGAKPFLLALILYIWLVAGGYFIVKLLV